MVLAFVAASRYSHRQHQNPLGSFGGFLLVLRAVFWVSALVFSYIGKIGLVNFRMDQKALGYAVIQYLADHALWQLLVCATVTDAGANSREWVRVCSWQSACNLCGKQVRVVLSCLFIELVTSVFKIKSGSFLAVRIAWSGCYFCHRDWGLQSVATGSEEPTAGYGAAQPSC